MGHPARRPDELSATLRRLRTDAALSGMEAARRAGYSQPKISRFETARQVPTAEEVHTLCRVYSAPPGVRERLLELAADLTSGTVRARASPTRTTLPTTTSGTPSTPSSPWSATQPVQYSPGSRPNTATWHDEGALEIIEP